MFANAYLISNFSQLKSVTVPTNLIAESAEEEQIELLLDALDELDYAEEYTLLASVHVNRLIARGNKDF